MDYVAVTAGRLVHFYHLYADGDWSQPVTEHFDALTASGLYDQLDRIFVGLVGSPENIRQVRAALGGYRYEVCAETREGFEQETLDQIWSHAQTHDGFVFYAHTKGAANYAPINDAWRRSMTRFNVFGWREVVAELEAGKLIAGCHWIHGNPATERLSDAWVNRRINPPGLDGVGGMFGGNYWWARLDVLRLNQEPSRESRHAAEHWLGQLSEVVPICPDTIYDMNPTSIVEANLLA